MPHTSQLCGVQRIHDHSIYGGMQAKGHVAPLVPDDARMVPVAPQVPGLFGRDHAIGNTGEDIAAGAWNPGPQREGRDHAQEFADFVVDEALALGVANMEGRPVAPRESGEVGHGNAQNGTREVLQRRHKSGVVPPEREAVDTDRCQSEDV